jgi:hypothetical protein
VCSAAFAADPPIAGVFAVQCFAQEKEEMMNDNSGGDGGTAAVAGTLQQAGVPSKMRFKALRVVATDSRLPLGLHLGSSGWAGMLNPGN